MRPLIFSVEVEGSGVQRRATNCTIAGVHKSIERKIKRARREKKWLKIKSSEQKNNQISVYIINEDAYAYAHT